MSHPKQNSGVDTWRSFTQQVYYKQASKSTDSEPLEETEAVAAPNSHVPQILKVSGLLITLFNDAVNRMHTIVRFTKKRKGFLETIFGNG